LVPRQTFMHRVLASADPARVWQGLQRPESWGRIGGVRNVEQPTFDDNGDLTGYRFTVELGGKTHFGVARRSGATPGSRVSMTIDTDLMSGEIDVELEPSDDQTAITVAMTIESKGFMTAMLFPVITGAIASGFNEEVARFAKGLLEDRLYPDHRSPEAGEQLD
jgi:carbon monoxide dehydrogenase subunit G